VPQLSLRLVFRLDVSDVVACVLREIDQLRLAYFFECELYRRIAVLSAQVCVDLRERGQPLPVRVPAVRDPGCNFIRARYPLSRVTGFSEDYQPGQS
jgi:hypothetical protein